MTGCPGVFAGGDMVPSERTVTVGVGHGKKAARHIDAWLRGAAAASRPKHDLATFDMLNLWFFGDAARRQQPELAPEERVAGFGEVIGGLSVEQATYEARPVPVVRQLLRVRRLPGRVPGGRGDQAGRRARLRFDYDRCTGCGACYEQCPVHSIEMFPEHE